MSRLNYQVKLGTKCVNFLSVERYSNMSVQVPWKKTPLFWSADHQKIPFLKKISTKSHTFIFQMMSFAEQASAKKTPSRWTILANFP